MNKKDRNNLRFGSLVDKELDIGDQIADLLSMDCTAEALVALSMSAILRY